MQEQWVINPEAALRIAERAESGFMDALASGAPAEAQRALGMSQSRVGGAVVLVMSGDPTGGFWNKALGFGVDEPVTEEQVAEVVGRYRAAGAPAAVLQVAPAALPDDWDDICGRHGLMASSVWAKLLRRADVEPAPADCSLRIGPLPPDQADEWARVFAAGFEMPPDPALLAMFATAVSRPDNGFHPWGGWDADRLVAGALLFVDGPVAAFSGAATLPEWRGRGAQSSFMHERILQSRELGCEWLSAETGLSDDNPSLHNMRRAGFVDVYARTNYVWRP